MTLEEKDLLLKDICARLPYGVMVSVQGGEFNFYKYPYQLTAISKFGFDSFCKVYHPIYTPLDVPKVEDVKPYLRSMSSMTKEEKKEYESFIFTQHHEWDGYGTSTDYVEIDDVKRYITWLNKKLFDYMDLIPKGLALEAPEGMYK